MSRTATHDILATPEEGYFLMRLVKGGWRIPCRIIFEDGLYQAEINGERVGPLVIDPLKSREVMRIWERGQKVEEPIYRHRIDLKAWAERHDTTHPAVNAYAPIDLNAMNPLFGD